MSTITMRKQFAILSLIAFVGFSVFTLASCVLPVTEWRHPSCERIFQPPYDFNLRLNELACLRDGVNPFDVWHGDVIKKPYHPHNHHELATAEFNEPINAYTPWGYTMAWPLSYLSKRVAWFVYSAFMFVCLLALAWGGYGVGRRFGDCYLGIIFATLPILAVAHPIWSNFNIGNYAVPILAALFMMCWCLDHGHDVWAGVFWSLAMIKPQNALLLAIPLLMRGKIKTCVVAAVICLAATMLPATICGASPLALILQAPAGSAHAFHGCATLPSYMCDIVGDKFSMPIAAAIGLIICIALTWRLHQCDSWLMYVLPAVMCSISWTYITSYSFSFSWVLVIGIMSMWATGVRSKSLMAISILAILLVPRFYTCWHGFAGAFGFETVADSLNYALDTTVSLGVLIVTIAFCLLWPRSLVKEVRSQPPQHRHPED